MRTTITSNIFPGILITALLLPVPGVALAGQAPVKEVLSTHIGCGSQTRHRHDICTVTLKENASRRSAPANRAASRHP